MECFRLAAMKINPPLQTEKMANRSMQRQNMRRFAHRQSGGGFGIVGSLMPIPADNAQFDYHPRVDARVLTDDCAIPDRTGQLHNAANPALAQAGWPLTGGSRKGSRKQRGGAYTESPFIRPSGWPQQGGAYTESPFIHPSGWTLDADTAKAQVVMAGGKRRKSRKSRKVRKSRKQKQRGGGCGCSGSKLMYGGARRRRTQRGGSKGGFMVDPSNSVGGSGPVAAPVYGAVPCDQPLYQTSLPSDPRAGAPYSLTPNTMPPTGVQAGGRRRKGRKSAKKQRGGSYSLSAAAPFSGSGNTNSYGNGNGFPASCYAAPGSQLPTYGATTAGLTFTPSTVANGSMTPGVVAYEEVVPVSARL